jgi:hypothetical protein
LIVHRTKLPICPRRLSDALAAAAIIDARAGGGDSRWLPARPCSEAFGTCITPSAMRA